MNIVLIAALAYIVAFGFTMLIGALSPAKPAAKPRKPVITEYRGPIYTAHGREVFRPTSKLRAV